MLPIPLRMVFRNKWFTLLWAAGICYAAVDFVSGQKDDGNSANAADSNLSQATDALR